MTEQTTELIQQTPSAKLFAHLNSADLWRWEVRMMYIGGGKFVEFLQR